MRKKGIGWGTFISLFFGVIVVSVIIFAIAFPGQLGSKTRDVSFSFGLGELPSERPPEFGGTPYVSKELKDYFDGLVAKIETFKDEEHCLIPLDQVPNLGRFRIHLKAPTIDGDPGKISLIKEGQGGFVVTDLKEFDDPGHPFYPCVVAWDGAGNFYNNWLDGSIAIPPITHEYYNNIDAMTINLESGTEIRTPNEGDAPGRKYDISDYDNRRYLYKADASHFCFISIHGGGGCSLKPSHKSIEEGCLDGMPFFVGKCDGSNDAVNRFYSNCYSICDRMDQECMIGIDDGKGITRCDDNSLRFEGYDDYCICGDASDKIGGSNQNCDDVCDTRNKECLLGIDEGRNAKKCTDEIDFDDSYDYCICGDVSQRVVPGSLPINDRECKDVCPGGMESCMIGIDDGNDIRKCNEDFNFEAGQTDDYCICGDDSEKVVPIPT